MTTNILHNENKNDNNRLKLINNKINNDGRPKQFDYIIGITSLWLLIPGLYGLLQAIKMNDHHNIFTGIMAAWTITCAIVSTLMWKNNINSSLLWKCDIICARVQFVLLILYFAFFCNVSWIIQLIFPSCVMMFYTLTDILYNKQKWFANTISHITFRYIGYLWTHIGLIQYTWRGILFLSCIYYSHILIHLFAIYDTNEFNINEKYFEGVLSMCVIISFSSFVYFLYF